jgi:Ca2+-binding RTX toxin-like protein
MWSLQGGTIEAVKGVKGYVYYQFGRERAMLTRSLLGALLVTSVLTTSSQVASAGGPTCFGELPTIVGTDTGDTLIGTPADDVIMGLGGSDLIRGMAGDDRICGDGGSNSKRDELFGGSGNDKLAGQPGWDLISGQDGSDRLLGGPGGGDGWPNELRGGRGHDRLIGGDWGDLFWPGAGSDVSVGNADDHGVMADALYFTEATRGVTVNMTTHTVTGQGQDKIQGIDEVHGSLHADVLIGDEDDNYMWGECADPYGYCKQVTRKGAGDVIKGRGGSDVLDGRAGPDRLDGGKGDDLVFGGFGHDTCSGEDVNECEN